MIGGFFDDFDAFKIIYENDAGETFVAADDVAAAAEDEIREVFLGDKIESLDDVGGIFEADAVAGVAAEAHGGEGGDGDVFLNIHWVIIP